MTERKDIVEDLRSLRDTMPLPERVKVATVTAADEIAHLREQRDRLQQNGSDLAKKNQRLRMQVMEAEELWRHIRLLTERALGAERVALKLFEAYDDAATKLSEEECYVIESCQHTVAYTGNAQFWCDGCIGPWRGTLDGKGIPSGRCPNCNSAFVITVSAPLRSQGTT